MSRADGKPITTNSVFGNEYNKYIYKEKGHGERYCDDKNLTLRREWRKMTQAEKRQFIQGVKCLKHKPSKTRPTGTLFDDFAFVAALIGRHSTSIILGGPARANDVGGGIPFWDWTKDTEALGRSPLLNEMPGFGGDGNPLSQFDNGTSGAYCVTDGNFRNHKATFDFEVETGIVGRPHCISRHFDPSDPDGRRVGALVAPSAITEIVALPDYATFSEVMQNTTSGPAAVIPRWVQGDMARYTAPNDVLYFLHLAQLDRIWWIWQHQITALRAIDYSGLRRNDREDLATLQDNLSLGTLIAPDVDVNDMMWAQMGFLCYTYYLKQDSPSH
ncbi:hypothetical protein Sste5346_001728 [Sporothrix stenoceras]|uniref:Tyrosinase copper-binding domain-containing protein n=1 Tax=Sporothrix stenoceras TaxID=5173 RepID=A0ABR3ZKR3_9PEZI